MKKKDNAFYFHNDTKRKTRGRCTFFFLFLFYPFCFCFGSLFQSFTHDFFCCFGLQNCTNTWIIFLLFNDFTKIKKLPVRFLVTVLPYVFTLYLYRKRFFTQGNSFLHRLQILFQEEYLNASGNSSKKNRFEFSFSCSHLSFFTPAFAVATI